MFVDLFVLVIVDSYHDITFLATRMAVAFGKINSFDPSQDEWPLYVERLGHVFVANGITEEERSEQFFFQ